MTSISLLQASLFQLQELQEEYWPQWLCKQLSALRKGVQEAQPTRQAHTNTHWWVADGCRMLVKNFQNVLNKRVPSQPSVWFHTASCDRILSFEPLKTSPTLGFRLLNEFCSARWVTGITSDGTVHKIYCSVGITVLLSRFSVQFTLVLFSLPKFHAL